MACNCINEVSEVCLKQIKEQCQEGETLQEIKSFNGEGMENTIFLMGTNNSVSGYALSTNFVFRTVSKKKDGTDGKPKPGHMRLIFTYCPFCGKAYKEDKATAEETSTEDR
jgi:hypothetical protein